MQKAGLFSVAVGAAISVTAGEKPNIVVILTDDIGHGDISCLNPKSGFQTPAIDALARDGMIFRQAHSTAAVCAPTRYALLTGNHVFRGREIGGVWTHCTPSQILPGQMTLADVLKKNGYRTAFFGKLHLGAQFPRRDGAGAAKFLRDADLSKPFFDGPIDHGFDYSLTLIGGIQHSPYAFFENDRLGRWNPERNAFDFFESDADARRVFKHKAVRGLTEEKLKKTWDENYRMDNYVSEQVGPITAFKALEFIRKHVADHPDQPFYMHLCAEAAHYPFTPPAGLSPDDPDNWDKPGNYPVKGKTPTLRTDMVYESDVTVGVLVEHLKKLGLYDNTLIVYTSDNGAAQYGNGARWNNPEYFCFKWGEFGGTRTDSDSDRAGAVVNPQGVADDGSPLKGQKGDVYEGGHRVPFVISGGKATAFADSVRGTVSQRLIGLHDLFATLCELSGIQVPAGQARDSVSFAGVLKGGGDSAEPVRDGVMLAEVARVCVPYEQAAVRRMAAESGWTLQTNAAGMVTGLTGAGAPDNKRISDMLEKDRLSVAVFSEEAGRRWKLVLTVNKNAPDQDMDAWELYELISDPDESDNLRGVPENKDRISSLMEQCRMKFRLASRARDK